MRHAIAILALLLATAAVAAPRSGANHRLGDDSFVARFGRAPTSGDPEKLRMRVHLEHVRELLAARPPTTPARADRRAALLGYLDEYIARGITPVNTYVPGRSPVFIDAEGNICAVGYLIERSVGRAVAERIAATHRLAYLEDIAVALPEVEAWIAASGFTASELASIQPGYPGPEVMHLAGWMTGSVHDDDWQMPAGEPLPTDGPYRVEDAGTHVTGAFARKQMTGTWTRMREGKVLGTGTFEGGNGTWTSFRFDGSRLAAGPFARSYAHGTWKIWHPSGRLAATGPMRHGARHGRWTFFYDSEAHGKLATGTFANGETLGGWKHFDADGTLVATVRGRAWTSLVIDIPASAAGVRRVVHQGIPADGHRLDAFYDGDEKLYVEHSSQAMWNGDGHLVVKTPLGWVARSCTWSKPRKASARRGDARALQASIMQRASDSALLDEASLCTGPATRLATARGQIYSRMLATRTQVRAPIPAWDIDPQPAGAEEIADEPESVEDLGDDNPADFATYLVQSALWYIEFPHVDATFVALYRSLPGYRISEVSP